MAERRMLWKRACGSRKVNSLSLKARLLWTWAIPWFDSKGYLEAEADYLKQNVVPKCKDILEEDIPRLVDEIVSAKLWIKFKNADGILVVKDPRFHEFQYVRDTREAESKLKDGLTPVPIPEHSGSTPPKIRLDEIRLEEAESRELSGSTPGVDASAEEKTQLVLLCSNCTLLFKNFNPYLFIQNHLNANPKALIHTLKRLVDNSKKIENPMAYAEEIIKVEDGNYNEAEHIQKAQKEKTVFNDIVQGIKKLQESRSK